MKTLRFIVIVFLFVGLFINAQTLNPPYPRLGIFTFTSMQSSYADANLDILKPYDVIATPPNEEAALLYKAQNPNRVVLGTSGCMIAYGMKNIPEAWYYHKTDGTRFLLFGSSYLMNLTTICPLVDMGNGPERFIDYAARHLTSEMDFSIIDGVFYDWWWGGMGSDAKYHGDLNSNGIADIDEWGIEYLRTVWQQGLIEFHTMQNALPGNPYSVLQVGTDWNIWPYVNGVCFEDWPLLNGLWRYWRGTYNDTKTAGAREPRLIMMDASHKHYWSKFPVSPYKNNYRAVRFALAGCLLTSGYFFVDEGNASYPNSQGVNGIGHHGNTHFYDEMEAKGMLGYPMTTMIKLTGKTNAGTTLADGVYVRFFDHGVSVVNATGLEQSIYASELAALDPAGSSSYYRIQGGQDPVFNNGEEVTNGNPLILWGATAYISNWNNYEVYGDGTMLFREPDTLITPIIIDNHINNQTSPGSEPIQHIGGWTLSSSGSKFYAFYTGRNYGPFQPDGFAWSSAGTGSNIALYVPTIGLGGYYEVSEWHGYRGSSPSSYPNATNVPIRIQYAGGGTGTVIVNQAQNHGRWNSLGVYPFARGNLGYAELTNQANGYVMADAVKFTFVRGFTPDEADSLDIGTGITVGFSDITAAGFGDTGTGTNACCFSDITGDSRPDLFLSRYRGEGSTDLCMINTNGISFSEEGVSRGVQDTDDGSQGACWGDLDNDGDMDLVTGTTVNLPSSGDHNNIYRNDGSGSFTLMTPQVMLSTLKKTRSVTLLDLEGDGDLDIFMVSGYQGTLDDLTYSHPNEVYRNDSNFAFAKLGAIECGSLESAPAGQGSTASDIDCDGDMDVLACNQSGDLNVLLNNGSGVFSLISPVSSIGISHRAGEGISTGDVDNDGDPDLLLVTKGTPSTAYLYLNDGDGTFTYSNQYWNSFTGMMGAFADLDNDGDEDLILAGYTRCLLNDGSGGFGNGPIIPFSSPALVDPRSLAFADIDDDGCLDFSLTDDDTKARLIRNEFNNGNHFLKIKVKSPQGQSGPFGSKVLLYPPNQAGGELLGYREIISNNGFTGQDDPVVHFGLAGYTAADVVVIFLDGTRQVRTFTQVDRIVEVNGEPPGQWASGR